MRTIAAWTPRLALLAALACAAALVGAAEDVRELEWDDLMPKDWDPFAQLEALRDANPEDVVDGSPEADRIMREFLTAGRSAPVVGELDGQRVRIPGFVVPLEFERTEVTEFLLVPYFGACIHVPPPPANQIVFVKTREAYALEQVFDAVWVTGTLRTQAHLNDVGDAGYTMEATAIERYE